MDHFAGFDRLLRVCLHRPAALHLVGPAGFVDRIAHRLASYSWNLLDEDSVDFRLQVTEFDESALSRRAEFRARDAFRRREAALPACSPGIVLQTDEFRIEAAVLDHGLPCLAFAFRERLRVNVLKDELAGLGLAVGPWLRAAKAALRRGDPDGTPVAAGSGRVVPLGELRERAFRTGPGQSLAYVTDAGFTEGNVARIVALARGVDQLFVEAAFLDEDAVQAASRFHLTAGQAGRLARACGARRLVPFHFSPRYLDRPEALAREAQAAFAA